MKSEPESEFRFVKGSDPTPEALLREVERRDFVKKAGRVTGGLVLAAYLGSLASCVRKAAPVVKRVKPRTSAAVPPPAGQVDLAVATGPNAAEITRKAVDALGGIGRFVKQGNVVLVKPNASFLDGPEAGTSTHPDVVGQVVAMCREAGAKRVIVMDHCLRGSPTSCLSANGIGDAVRRSGGEIIAYGSGDSGHSVETAVPSGVVLKSTDIYPEALSADVVITVPKAKHHGSAGLSLGMKNFIGVTGQMSNIHNVDLHQGIADLNTLVKPDLSIIDASVILLDNGPGGPGPTRAANTVIASPDVVAADSYACTLFGLSAQDVPYIVCGNRAGLGEVDYNKLKIARV